jgi:hypothetical protein
MRSSSTALKMYLRKVLGQRRVVVEVGERDLRLDHPELGQVPRRVRVLGAERRAKCIHLAQREAVAFDVQLAGHGQVGFLAEEILVPVDGALVVARQVDHVERRHTEHLAGALGIARGDDRRVDPEEAALVEVAVDRLGDAVAHARDSTERVRARAQVRDLAQVLHRVRFRLDRVGLRIVDPADDFDLRCLDLEALALALGRHQRAGRDHRAAGSQLGDLVGIVGERIRRDDLDRVEAGAVADVDERQACLRVAARAHPAANRDFAAGGDGPGQCLFDAGYRHGGSWNIR